MMACMTDIHTSLYYVTNTLVLHGTGWCVVLKTMVMHRSKIHMLWTRTACLQGELEPTGIATPYVPIHKSCNSDFQMLLVFAENTAK